MATSWKKDPVTGQLIKVETPTTTPSITNPYTNQSTLYGQTSVAPKPTTPLSPTQPVATPAPIQPTTPPIGGGVGISPQTQQIQTQIEETKAKIKELQGVKDLMDKGYQVQRPGETANTQPDILSELEQRRTGEFQSYLDFLKGQPSPLENYKRFSEELGIPSREKAVMGVQEQVLATEKMIDDLEKNLQARSGGFLVTSPMYQRQLGLERRPLIQEYTKLLREQRGMEAGTQSAKEQLANLIALSSGEQKRQADLAKTMFEFRAEPTTKEEIAVEVAKKKAIRDAGLTEAETQIIEKEGRQVLINKNTGETIKDLGAITPKAPATPTSYDEWSLAGGLKGTGKTYSEWLADKGETQTEKTTALKIAAIAKATPELEKSKGTDNYVNPNVYMKLRNDYVQAIGDVSEFDETFAPMLSPKERIKLGVGKIQL